MFLTNAVQDASEAPGTHPAPDARGRQAATREAFQVSRFGNCQ